MGPSRRRLIVCLCVAAASLSAAAEDHGFSVPPVTRQWQLPLPFTGLRHLGLGDQMVLVGSADGLNARAWPSGEVVWTADVPSSGPLLAGDGRVFVVAGGELVALTEVNGRVLWRQPLGSTTTPPAYRAGWIIAVDDANRLVGIRAEDGQVVWTSAASPGVLAHAPVIDGGRLFTLAADGSLQAWNILDGAPLWRAWGPANGGALLAAHGRIYATGDGRLTAWRQTNGDRDWSYPVDMPTVSRLAADPDHVFIATLDNTVRAHRPSGGHQQWKQRVEARVVDGLTSDAGLLFVPMSDGIIRLFRTEDGRPAGELAPPVTNARGMTALVSSGVGSALRMARLFVTESEVGLETLHRATLPVTPATGLAGTPISLSLPGPPSTR